MRKLSEKGKRIIYPILFIGMLLFAMCAESIIDNAIETRTEITND